MAHRDGTPLFGRERGSHAVRANNGAVLVDDEIVEIVRISAADPGDPKSVGNKATQFLRRPVEFRAA